jgi:predicted transcriptional regulator
MSDLTRYLDKQLEDPSFKKEWDKLELRYAVIRQLVKIRNTYDLSQAELAKKLNTTQSVISRIENGTVNIGIDFLEKLARAFDKKVEIRWT